MACCGWTGMPAGGPHGITACSVKGETSSLPPGYLTPLLVAVPIAGSRFSETFQQALGLGFRRIRRHRRESKVSKLFFFSGKHPERPLSREVPFSSLLVEVGKLLMFQSFMGTLEQSCVIKQGESLSCLTPWENFTPLWQSSK